MRNEWAQQSGIVDMDDESFTQNPNLCTDKHYIRNVHRTTVSWHLLDRPLVSLRALT